MDILGIGPLELLFILFIALLIFGPEDLAKTGKTLGKFMRTVVKTPFWASVRKTSDEIKSLPTKLMREAGIDEVERELKDIREEIDGLNLKSRSFDNKIWEGNLSTWTTPPKSSEIDDLEKPDSGEDNTPEDQK